MPERLILLINPWIYDFAAYDFWIKPLGLLYIASLLRENGYSVFYLDCLNIRHPKMKNYLFQKPLKRTEYGSGRFYKEIVPKPLVFANVQRRYGRYGIVKEIFWDQLTHLPQPPSAVLITSAMTYWYPGVFEAIRLVKKAYPGVPIILGGIYATLCYDHAVSNSKADFVVKGEGEVITLQLLSQIDNVKINYCPNPLDLDSYPYPAFDLISDLEYVCLLTTRGCPFNCIYCATRVLSGNFRRRNPIKVADEIEFFYKKFGVKNFVFYDDALNYEPERHFIPLLEEIINRKIEAYFHAPNGLFIRGFSSKLANLMYRAGFKTVRLGLETVNENTLKIIGNKVTQEEFISAVNYLSEAGYKKEEIGVYLLVGLPNQNPEEVQESIYFVKKCGARPYLSEYSPIPHTALFAEAIKCSFFPIETEPLCHNNSVFPCQSEKFTQDRLNELKQLAKKPNQ